MTNIKVDKVARLILNADGTYTTVTKEVFNGKTYNVYLPTEPTPTSHERWRCVWLEYLKRGNGVLTNDIRYGTDYCFSKVMLAIARVCTAVYIPKPRVNIYRTHLCMQWVPVIDMEKCHGF